MITVGIDFGTSNSCIAVLRDGDREPVVVPSAEGDAVTPSVVAFLAAGERIVGIAAKRQALKNAAQTVSSAKRFLGHTLDEVVEEAAQSPQQLTAGPNGAVRFLIDGKEISPEQVSALVLAKLKADVEEFYGEPVGSAVLTVPAHWGDPQRQALREAARAAGLQVIGIVNEPTAAAIAYGFGKLETAARTIVVFDLGGGTFDVSAVKVEDGEFTVLATAGDNGLGGDDFDALIVEFLRDSARTGGVEIGDDPLTLQRLQEAAERAKIELSSLPQTTISLPFIAVNENGPVHLEETLTREQFEGLIEPLISKMREPISSCLESATLGPGEIDDVVLVGGMTRMPAVQAAVAELLGRFPKRGVHPGHAVALGAAIRAAVVTGQAEGAELRDVTPLSLGLEVITGMTERLIEANTPLPAAVREIFSTAEDNQTSVELRVVQGERVRACDNRRLGVVKLRGLEPAPAYQPEIEVMFELNEDGILRVSARDLATGLAREAVIEAAASLSSDEVDEMRAEAEAFAAADRELRERSRLQREAKTLRAVAAPGSPLAEALDRLAQALSSGSISSLRDIYAEIVSLKQREEEVSLFDLPEMPVREALD